MYGDNKGQNVREVKGIKSYVSLEHHPSFNQESD